MKRCPNCYKYYDDPQQSFCLNDGAALIETGPPPPTVMFEDPLRTNEIPIAQHAPIDRYTAPNNMATYPYGMPQFVQRDRTLPIISMVLGILSIVFGCCYLGIPFGIGALITGYIATNNIKKDPFKFDGNGMAIAGMILGGVAIISTIFIIIGVIFAN